VESVWIRLFSSAPKPYSRSKLTLTGKSLHEITAGEFDVDIDSFWISCAIISIPPSETFLDEVVSAQAPPSSSRLGEREQALSNDLWNASCSLPSL